MPTDIPANCVPLTGAITSNEHHLVLGQDAARLRLCLRSSPTDCLGYLVIERDGHALTRLAAAARFERARRGRRIGPGHLSAPAAYRRIRLIQLLEIHDGLDAGASPRDLAFGLVFAHHRPLAGATWKGSDERRHTLRLIAEARRLVSGGYRKLLRHA